MELTNLRQVLPSLNQQVLTYEDPEDVAEQTEVLIKYEGYIQKEQELADKTTQTGKPQSKRRL